MAKNKAVFFDRDGIINERKIGGYIQKVSEFSFLPNFFKILRRVKRKGYLAIVVTNQQGIGKGLMTEDDLKPIHDFMQERSKAAAGFSFDDIFYCPDLEGTGSKRRKPEAGMILEAAEKWDISLSESWMIGDTLSDIEAGNRAGTNTILVSGSKGYTEHSVPTLHVPSPDYLEMLVEFLPKA